MFAVLPILDLIRAHRSESSLTRIFLDGVSVGIGNRRLRTFAEHGTTCTGCGLEGQGFVILDHSLPNTSAVVHSRQLFGRSEAGERVWLTQDHILARALGGLDTLQNSQPLCQTCNQRKARQETLLVAYLRQRCGLDPRGHTAKGYALALEQALRTAGLDLAWADTLAHWDWQSDGTIADHLAQWMAPLPPLDDIALAREQDQLERLAQWAGLTPGAYRYRCNHNAHGVTTGRAQRAQAPAAQLGLTLAGYAFFRATWQDREAIRQRRQDEKDQRLAKAREAQDVLLAMAPKTTPAPISVSVEDRIKRPSKRKAKLAEYATDLELLADALETDLDTYRAACEMRSQALSSIMPISASLAHGLGLSHGALAIFLSDRSRVLCPNQGLAGLKACWQTNPRPSKRALNPDQLARRLTLLTQLAEYHGLDETAYRAHCEAVGTTLPEAPKEARWAVQAAQLGLSISGFKAFEADHQATWPHLRARSAEPR